MWKRYRLPSQKIALTFERDPYFNMTSPFSSHNRRLVLYEAQFASYYHNKWKVVRLRTFVSRTHPLLEHAQSKLCTYLQLGNWIYLGIRYSGEVYWYGLLICVRFKTWLMVCQMIIWNRILKVYSWFSDKKKKLVARRRSRIYWIPKKLEG